MDLAAEIGLAVREENLTLYDVYTADECFLTGTAAELVPAVALDERVIGDGCPGPLPLRLLPAFRQPTAASAPPASTL